MWSSVTVLKTNSNGISFLYLKYCKYMSNNTNNFSRTNTSRHNDSEEELGRPDVMRRTFIEIGVGSAALSLLFCWGTGKLQGADSCCGFPDKIPILRVNLHNTVAQL